MKTSQRIGFLLFLAALLAIQSVIYGLMLQLTSAAVVTWNLQPEQLLPSSSGTPIPNSPYVYTFVIGGVNPLRPSYRGMLWGICVNVYALKKYGSTADFIVFVQLSPDAPTDIDPVTFGLSPTELRVLSELGVRLRYIPTSPGTNQTSKSFHDITMNKFIILTLTEYKRVFFLDADLVLLSNLDYLFRAADASKTESVTQKSFLRPNFYVATAGEPSNAGFFMLSPRNGDYDKVLEIVRRQKESAKDLPGDAKFDKVLGWGHAIQPPDFWETTRLGGTTAKGTEWFFYCAPSDQGLLYYWTKYYKEDVSIMVRDDLKNWGAYGANKTHTRLDAQIRDPFAALTNETLKSAWSQCHRKHKWWCVSPHRDYEHLAGTLKPWLQPMPPGAIGANAVNQTRDALHYWFHLFYEMSQKYKLDVDFDKWEDERKLVANPPLGWKPHYYRPKCTGCQFQ